MQWVRENSKPHKLELHYSLDREKWQDVQNHLIDAKTWCNKSNIMFWTDGFFYIRFMNERDLSWFLLR